MKFSKIALCSAVTVLLSTCLPGFAESVPDAPYDLPTMTAKEIIEDNKNIISEKEKPNDSISEITLTSEEAVAYGLEHNTTLKTLEKKIDLASVALNSTIENYKDLQDAKKKIEDAETVLNDSSNRLNSLQADLNDAQAALNAGFAPTSIPLMLDPVTPLVDSNGAAIVIPAGTHIRTALGTLPVPALNPAVADAIAVATIATIQSQLDSNQAQINTNATALASASETFKLKKKEFDNVLSNVSESIDMKLQNTSNVVFDADEAGELMLSMAGVNLNVTRYAKRIYKNQIAMLIQKEYHDALLAQRTLELKLKAEERGQKQYELVTLSYQNGMKSKQDMLLSKMYYNSTQVATRVAQSEYKNALYKLKNDMNISLDCNLMLVEPEINTDDIVQLEDALKSGMINRIDVQKSLGKLEIMKVNYQLLNNRVGNFRDANGEAEARAQLENAELELHITQSNAASDIRQSYENLMAMKDSLAYTEELIKNAKEVVEIAKLKYDQGFGSDNALLQSLNLESSSGTIVELIASEEKLSEVEEKVATIKYNYIMAKIKYYNDAALLNSLEK